MRNSIVILLAAASSVAAASTVGAQAPDLGSQSRSRSAPQKKSGFKGPNAAFKNQQRKVSDPLNANGK